MNLAIPIWNDRISPLLDTACRIMICSVGPGGYGEREEHDLRGLIAPMKVRRIKELGADVLICGAVSKQVAFLIDRTGIKLVPWISGPVDEVLDAFRAGLLDEPRYFMPGCRGRGRRRRRRRRECGSFIEGDL
jgi:predicted Fe-Mo cluster-binding NifX family protein